MDDQDTNDQKKEETQEVSSAAEAMEDKQAEAAETQTETTTESDNKTKPEPDDSVAKTESTNKGKSESSEKKSVSKDLEKIIESIEKLSVLELADLVHSLEDRFGVTAAAPMAVAGAAATGSAEAPGEEQTTFNVILTSAGANKIGAIKAVRELVPTLGLKEAKDLVEAAPKPVMEGVNKETANEAKNKLTAAGATVELQ